MLLRPLKTWDRGSDARLRLEGRLGVEDFVETANLGCALAGGDGKGDNSPDIFERLDFLNMALNQGGEGFEFLVPDSGSGEIDSNLGLGQGRGAGVFEQALNRFAVNRPASCLARLSAFALIATLSRSGIGAGMVAGLPPFRASLISASRLAAKMKAAFLFDPARPSAAIVPDSTAAIIRFTGTLKARPSSDAVW